MSRCLPNPYAYFTTDASPHESVCKEDKGSDLRLSMSLAGGQTVELSADQAGLGQLSSRTSELATSASDHEMEFGIAQTAICSLTAVNELLRIRFLELSPSRMRLPSAPGARNLGNSGDNLSAVLEGICSDSKRKSVLISWLQDLTPMDVQTLEFPRDPSGRVHLRLVERSGRQISAYSASDGTLRFLAILAALLSRGSTTPLFPRRD